MREKSSFGYFPRWSPDSSQILFQTHFTTIDIINKFYVAPLDGGPPKEVLNEFPAQQHNLWPAAAVWHPDGKRVSLWVTSLAAARSLSSNAAPSPSIWTLPISGGPAIEMEIAPAIKNELVEAANGNVGGEHQGEVSFAWSPSGKALYFECGYRGAINIWKMTVEPETLRATAIARLTTGPSSVLMAWVLTERGIPVAPLPPKSKAANLPNWQDIATTDLSKLFQLHPNADANTAAVARADDGGFCFFEVDRANYHSVIEKMTGHKFPDTFCVSSRPGQGRGHFYFKHTAASIALGNAQAKDENGELWSFRANDRYVVGPLSVHPEGPTHTVVKNSPIASVPDWLVQWISQNKSSAATKVAADNKSEIVEGGRNNALTSLAGKLRQAGLDSDQIHTTLLEENQKRCVPPLPDTEVRTIAYSVGRYPVAPDAPPVIMGGKNLSDPTATPVEDMSWLDTSQAATRPVFPTWIMYGTSLFEGLAKPVSDVNAKHPELIWLPAVQLLMNYMSGKVEIDKIRVHTNMFLGIISSPGKFFKSSSCKLAHEYFEQMLLVKKLTPNLRNAEGTVVIGQAGSSEGFGAQMYKANAKHGVLFNDELGKLVSKAGIENSSLPHDLLQWYESSDYSNPVKTAKSNFAFEAGTYCFGWQFCTTVRGFNSQWARILGIASGMPDRMFFLLSPEQPKPMSPENYVNTSEGAFKTKQLIEQAMTQKTYTIASYVAEHLRKKSSALNDPRSMNMVYKFALYFAIDLGLDEIDEDCVDRALALVDYRQKAIAFLQPIEARNEEGRLLLEIKRELRQHGGKMTRREFAQNMHPEQHGERVWNMVYKGAISGDHIREFTEQGARGQTRRMVGLVTDDVRLGPE